MPDLLPPNATIQERAISLSVNRLPTVPLKTLWTPATCPEAQLPWLAWALSVDEWDAAWPIETKREVIAASIEQHRKKGTVGALRRALQRLGYEVDIDEATGVAYTFKIRVRLRAGESAGGSVSEDVLNRSIAIALRHKNARSFLSDTLYVADTDPAGLFVGGVTLSGLEYESRQDENYVSAPVNVSSFPSGGLLRDFTWDGNAEFFEIEIRNRNDDSLVFPTIVYTSELTSVDLVIGEYYFLIRSALEGRFSAWVRHDFDIIITPPFNVVASNDSEPAFLQISFNCFGNTFVIELCGINNEWTTDVQSSGGSPVSGVGQSVYTGIMSGFYDIRVKAVYSFGESEWVEVRNIEVLPFP